MHHKKSNQPLYFQIVLIVGFVFIAFMLFALARSIYRDLFQVGRYIGDSQTEIAEQKTDLAQKPDELAYSQSPRYQEKIAKELLGLRLPGEEVIILSGEEQKFEDLLPENLQRRINRELLTNPQKWWRYLFGL